MLTPNFKKRILIISCIRSWQGCFWGVTTLVGISPPSGSDRKCNRKQNRRSGSKHSKIEILLKLVESWNLSTYTFWLLTQQVLRMDTDVWITLVTCGTGGSSMYSEWVAHFPERDQCSPFKDNASSLHAALFIFVWKTECTCNHSLWQLVVKGGYNSRGLSKRYWGKVEEWKRIKKNLDPLQLDLEQPWSCRVNYLVTLSSTCSINRPSLL